jgi:hypothetical protein
MVLMLPITTQVVVVVLVELGKMVAQQVVTVVKQQQIAFLGHPFIMLVVVVVGRLILLADWEVIHLPHLKKAVLEMAAQVAQ